MIQNVIKQIGKGGTICGSSNRIKIVLLVILRKLKLKVGKLIKHISLLNHGDA